MIISVTKKHIKKGKPISPLSCPIALALKAAGYPSAVGRETFNVLGEENHRYALPIVVRQFIDNFDGEGDGDRSLKPFSFTVPLRKRAKKNK